MLGVDPGSRTTGFAFLRSNGQKLIPVEFGEVRVPTRGGFPERLAAIYDTLDRKVRIHRPQGMALEALFVAKGLQSMIKLAYAKGVVLLLAARHDLPVFEYSALAIKKAVVGYGLAEKTQVQFMVQRILSLVDTPRPDEADALAVAICHLHTHPRREASQSR
ncbi:MAG: crossover junction endodeoxyribonuclease RuvC [Nitrospirae bacterium]|nr:crossover junction endodeoxyribonuclease RuvC [Nitrospirota bacterium]